MASIIDSTVAVIVDAVSANLCDRLIARQLIGAAIELTVAADVGTRSGALALAGETLLVRLDGKVVLDAVAIVVEPVAELRRTWENQRISIIAVGATDPVQAVGREAIAILVHARSAAASSAR